MNIKIRSVFASVILCSSFSLLAQTIEEDELDQVTVRQTWPRVNEASRQTIRVDAEMIRDLPVRDLGDLLKFLPGVEMKQRGPFGTQADVSLRGTTFNQVLVLIDGMPVNDPLTGHFNMNLPILIGDIASVEIIMGPASSLYGPDAVGGVINIVTNSFRYKLNDSTLRVRGDVTGGQFGLFGSELIGRTGSGFTMGARLLNSSGQDLNGSDARSYFKQHGFMLSKVSRLGKHWILKARVNYDYRDFDARYYYTNSTFDQSVEKVRRVWGQTELRRYWKNGSNSSLSIAHVSTQDSFIFNRLFTPNLHNAETSRARIYHQFKSGLQGNVSIGADAERVQVKSNDRGDHTLYHTGIFGIWKLNLKQGFQMQMSSRLDYENTYDLQFVPQFDVHKEMKRWTWYFNAGRSIRSADLTERYVSNNLPGPLPEGRNLGNPELVAENYWNVEMGSSLDFAYEFELDGGVFLREASNMIDFVYTEGRSIETTTNIADTSSYFYTRNIESLTMLGSHIDLSYRSASNRKYQANGVIGVQYLTELGDANSASKYVSTYANWLVNGEFRLALKKRGFISLQAMYKMRESDRVSSINRELESSYYLINCAIGAYLLDEQAALSIECMNLLDEQYSDILGAPLPRRWIFGKLRIELGEK